MIGSGVIGLGDTHLGLAVTAPSRENACLVLARRDELTRQDPGSITAWLLLARNQSLAFMREPAAANFNLAVAVSIIALQASARENTRIGDDLPAFRVAGVLPVNGAVSYLLLAGLFPASISLAAMVEARTPARFQLRPGGVGGLLGDHNVALVVLAITGLTATVLAAGWGVCAPARPPGITPASALALSLSLAVGALVASFSRSPHFAQGIDRAIVPNVLSEATLPIDRLPRGRPVAADAFARPSPP